MKTPVLLALPLLLALGRPARAQAGERVMDLPTCAERGTPRLAVMPPPVADPRQVRAAVEASGAVPPGATVELIDEELAPPLVDHAAAERQLGRLLFRLGWEGRQVEGEAVSIVRVDAEGRIEEVAPGSGNGDVDRALRTFWRSRRFAPPVLDGCRVPAWVRVPIHFRVFPDRVEVQVQYPALKMP